MCTKTEFRYGEVYGLLDQVEKGSDKVHFRNIFETKHGGVSLIALEAGQKLDTHLAPFEVMVIVQAGEIEFTMDGQPYDMKAGEFLLMGQNVPHSVVAKAAAKLLLVKVKA